MRSRLIGGICLSAMGALLLSTDLIVRAHEGSVAEAAMAGDRDTVRALLKQGEDVNAAMGDGMTALHWAAKRGDVELAQMLLYAGANVKATTRLGAYTPLILASQVGKPTMIDLLLKSGADAKAATTNGTTPLMLAATAGSAEAVKLLLDKGADPNAKENARGETALMFAANYNRVDAMKALLAAGANINLTTSVVDLASLTQGGLRRWWSGPRAGRTGRASGSWTRTRRSGTGRSAGASRRSRSGSRPRRSGWSAAGGRGTGRSGRWPGWRRPFRLWRAAARPRHRRRHAAVPLQRACVGAGRPDADSLCRPSGPHRRRQCAPRRWRRRQSAQQGRQHDSRCSWRSSTATSIWRRC